MNTAEIFTLNSNIDFEKKALEVFEFQYQNNPIYKNYCNLLNKNRTNVYSLSEIPFLPIEFFKSKEIKSFNGNEQAIFLSSRTTGMLPSRHFVANLELYEQSFTKAFELFYGPIEDYTLLALLPSYLEYKGSSLIYMINKLIEQTGRAESGFFLNNQDELFKRLQILESRGQKSLLIGVSYALLDFAEIYAGKISLKNTIMMETGGMKGRRKEMLRAELHSILKKSFKLASIHSEYGMTELLSQAYSMGNEVFFSPPWMKILIRDTYDPFCYVNQGSSGAINLIDLANIYSCSFIETMDLGKINKNDSFEVLGRFDASDVRGCNLMVN